MRIRFIDVENQDPRIQHRRRQQARRTRIYRQRQQARNVVDVCISLRLRRLVLTDTETESGPIQIEGSTESGEHGSNDESVDCVEGDAAEYDCDPYVKDEPILFGEEHDLRVETQVPQATATLPLTALAHFLTVLLKAPNASQAILDFPLNHPPEQHNDDSSLDLGGLSISEGYVCERNGP
ncbi:hypothetical protein THARTR1_11247 [Trichoderma harzianum]|uniref:Uncharacterized protein n=1 Tax=Trichoderma harzianum TaxID=5544 RepID=A0A2K0T469_TRIHA|nr:hypothetical protein THARTR1_11247 [Trichoderma harzianum]